MAESAPRRRWPAHVSRYLREMVIDTDEYLDVARRRYHQRFGGPRPRHIAAFRAFADAQGVELTGRVLASKPLGGPKDDDGWWDNLLNTYRRFESDEVAGVELVARFRAAEARTTSDAEGYYRVRVETRTPASGELWENATIALADGTLLTPQPVLQVAADVRVGIISDIDDTILQSSILDWKVAAQLTFLHNARTRKPLQGVAKLYQALQRGPGDAPRNPIFYVSSSPWNLYDLLEDFLELNAIPHGPIFLRDLGFDPGKFLKSAGHGHKLERAREIIAKFPQLRWVLLGDSGQADAELYAEAAQEFGDRILAIYIRDVDPDVADSERDRFVDQYVERVAGTKVPMLRASDSRAIAEHAAKLGLISNAAIAEIETEVQRDQQRPTVAEAAAESAAKDLPAPAREAVKGAAKAAESVTENVAAAAKKVGKDVEKTVKKAAEGVTDTARAAAGKPPKPRADSPTRKGA
jgi:phosphatidate phosphatase APP1